jgi:excisionase family DNA binding protein
MESLILNNITVTELRNLISEAVAQQVKHLNPPAKDPELLTRSQVAKILGISLPTLNDWTKRGIIPALRIASRVRYKKEDVYQALEKVETLKYKKG